jgi:glycosyltransferase involved in cell wall biosynthesis
MNSSKVSIIVSSYNKASYIFETVESIINQTFSNWELIIIDDMSTDDTLKIISNFSEEDYRILLYNNYENKGANYCRNFGANIASGDYFMFLDADDLLSPTCIENRINVIKKYPVTDFVVFPMGTFKNQIGDSNMFWIPKKEKALERFLSHDLPWAICQPLWKKESFLKLGGFDESFKRLQDVELHTRALFHNLNFHVAPQNYQPDCHYRITNERIQDKQKYISNFTIGVMDYYNKFITNSIKNNLQVELQKTILETFLYLSNYSFQNDIIEHFISKQKDELMSKFNGKYFKKILNFYFYNFISKGIYLKGTRVFFVLLLKISNINSKNICKRQY